MRSSPSKTSQISQSPICAHRFSNFVKELSLERLKFNSQLSSATNPVERQSFSSRREIPSTAFLSQSVMEILNSGYATEKKENTMIFRSETKKKHPISNASRDKIKELVAQIATLEISIIQKKTEIQTVEEILSHEQRSNHHKTVIYEQSYNNLTADNAKTEEEIRRIQEKLNLLKEKGMENEKVLGLMKEKKELAEAKIKEYDECYRKRLGSLKKQLEGAKNRNEGKQVECNALEEMIAKGLKISKNSLKMQINRKEKEIEILKMDIDMLGLKLGNQRQTMNSKAEELNEKLREINSEIEKIHARRDHFVDLNCREKAELLEQLEQLNRKLKAPDEDLLILTKQFENSSELNNRLAREKTQKIDIFKVTKERKFQELEQKSSQIKENQVLLEKLNKDYEKLERKSKEMESTVLQKLQTGSRKIEAKKQKNKLLINLIQNMPVELAKAEEERSRKVISMNEEKRELEIQLERLKKENNDYLTCMEDMKELESGTILEQLEVQNLVNELEEIRNLLRQKQEALRQTKEFHDKCKTQLENAL